MRNANIVPKPHSSSPPPRGGNVLISCPLRGVNDTIEDCPGSKAGHNPTRRNGPWAPCRGQNNHESLPGPDAGEIADNYDCPGPDAGGKLLFGWPRGTPPGPRTQRSCPRALGRGNNFESDCPGPEVGAKVHKSLVPGHHAGDNHATKLSPGTRPGK